jgi:hypothetical protein
MTEMLPERDDGRFEEVLGRLDALVRRGQSEIEPPPPPLVEEPSIPVLTEIYQPQEVRAESIPTLDDAVSLAPERSIEDKLQLMLAMLLPEMERLVEGALASQVKPALEQALNQAIVDLRPQIEAALRQRLRQVLAGKSDQAEG